MFRPAFGCAQHPKAGRNTRQTRGSIMCRYLTTNEIVCTTILKHCPNYLIPLHSLGTKLGAGTILTLLFFVQFGTLNSVLLPSMHKEEFLSFFCVIQTSFSCFPSVCLLFDSGHQSLKWLLQFTHQSTRSCPAIKPPTHSADFLFFI